jgi:hypothetical protein
MLVLERCKIAICHQSIVEFDESLYLIEITQALPSVKN